MVVATTGFFDGVHLGHREVIKRLCSIAKEKGAKSEVITFWPHPRSVLQQDAFNLRLLTTLEEKKYLLKKMGVNRIKVLEFTKQFSLLSTEEFCKRFLIEKFGVSTLVIGYDHRIGHDTSQSQDEIISVCTRCGLEVVRVEENRLDGDGISSTKIRRKLDDGDILSANNLLGYCYSLEGVVVRGNGIGRTIGFPTANLKLYAPLKLVPADGVYAVRVRVNREKSKIYMGICNIGYRPTIGSRNEKTIETHILDFNEDIYGLDLRIEFVQRMRGEKKFGSLEDLKRQLESDKQSAICLL